MVVCGEGGCSPLPCYRQENLKTCVDTSAPSLYTGGTPTAPTGQKALTMETVTLIATAVLACIGCSFGGYGLGILRGFKAASAKVKTTKAE
jgi:hypothetical protein